MNLDLSWCLGDDVALVKCSFFGLKTIVNNVAVTPVYALWHIMCAGHVSELLIIILWFINLFETNSISYETIYLGMQS